MAPVIISPADLAALLEQQTSIVLLDVRWSLAEPDGGPAYLAGHLPGAIFVDLDHELAAPATPAEGRHPLPDPEQFQRAARSWGIDDDSTIVVYDDSGNLAAARAWWLLRHAGLKDVRLLDGGMSGWVTAGLPTVTGESVVESGSVEVRFGSLPTVDADGAADYAARGRLLDVRAAERFRGETEPIDPRAGHIPGARNAPTTGNLDAEQRFLDLDVLRHRFLALDLPAGAEVAVSCGSGVTAAHTAAALTLAGYRPVLYPGSWSQWSADPTRPIATGA